VREEVHPQQGDQVRERPGEPGPQLEILEEQHGDQRRPDLDLQGVGARSHEGLDLQVLLQGLEEQFDLPAVLVDRTDRRGPEGELVVRKTRVSFFSGSYTSTRRRSWGHLVSAATPVKRMTSSRWTALRSGENGLSSQRGALGSVGGAIGTASPHIN
jgi:hypothetical protein